MYKQPKPLFIPLRRLLRCVAPEGRPAAHSVASRLECAAERGDPR